eukprot:scaffold1024_cov144-Skeletonema_marinoi.AAC.1
MQDWSSQRNPNPNHDPPTSVGCRIGFADPPPQGGISSCIGRLCTEPPPRGGKSSSVAATAIVVIRQGLSTVSAHGQESARASVDFALIHPLEGEVLSCYCYVQVSPPPPAPVDLSAVSVDFTEPPPRGGAATLAL